MVNEIDASTAYTNAGSEKLAQFSFGPFKPESSVGGNSTVRETAEAVTAEAAGGSGVLVAEGEDEHGAYVDVLTNRHVVPGAIGSKVEVTLPDGTTTRGTIVQAAEGDRQDEAAQAADHAHEPADGADMVGVSRESA